MLCHGTAPTEEKQTMRSSKMRKRHSPKTSRLLLPGPKKNTCFRFMNCLFICYSFILFEFIAILCRKYREMILLCTGWTCCKSWTHSTGWTRCRACGSMHCGVRRFDLLPDAELAPSIQSLDNRKTGPYGPHSYISNVFAPIRHRDYPFVQF